MQENNKPIVAKGWICKHANGINPLDGSTIPGGDIVNNVHISRCLFFVAELLDSVGEKSVKKSNKDKCMSPEDLAGVHIVERTFISNFVNEINYFVPGNMKPVSFRKILIINSL